MQTTTEVTQDSQKREARRIQAHSEGIHQSTREVSTKGSLDQVHTVSTKTRYSTRSSTAEIRRDYTKDTGKEFKYESGVHRVENFEVDPEHERALNLLRERGRIDLVQQGLPRNAKIHNYLLSHTDVEEVGTGIFQYRMIKEEEE